MKILITTDWYSPAVNGVVTSVLNLRRELTARGHEVRVLTLSRSPRSFVQDGVYFLGSVPAGLVYPGARLRTAPAKRFARELVAWRPDVVHSQCEFSTFPLARGIARALDIPLIHAYHTVYENYTHYFSPSVRWGRWAAAFFTRWVAVRTDCLIAPTEKTESLLRGYRVDCPIRVAPTGIDLRRFRTPEAAEDRLSLRRELGIPDGNTVVLFVGRLAEEKNPGELLNYLTAFRGRPVTLLFVGDGPCREALESRVRELGLSEQVCFTGMVSPERIPAYYRLGDLFVSASTSETQGLTYLEALASGLPALCRADDCLTGVVTDGENGWQYHTEAEFYDRLERFLADPALRAAMGTAARDTAGSFGADAFAATVESIYREILARPRAAADGAADGAA